MVGPRVALIGCGLIGAKRATTLPSGALRIACDVVPARAQALAHDEVRAEIDWQKAVASSDVDAVIVATTHDQLPIVGTAAARAGKHVFLEKPGARRASELDELKTLVSERALVVRTGFNHRFHRAMRKARELIDADAIGKPQYIRGRYGHGGRPGYDREWRSLPELSGGGEAIDQGIHLIDLSRWFLGDFNSVSGLVATFFWEMPVEDNAFMLLRTAEGSIAQLHASWTEWKNLFSFEIFGRGGKLEITGLGGSYGTERLTWYRMLPEMGPPETTTWEFPMPDDSWQRETDSFLADIAAGHSSAPGIDDAQQALRIVERLYAAEDK